MFKNISNKKGISLENIEEHKKIIIQLRWVTIIVTSYLILSFLVRTSQFQTYYQLY